MKEILLCTDLDRTLIPNGAQPESPNARTLFSRLVAAEPISLAYVSGRHKGLIQEAIAQYQLPVPDFAIADVGSTIYQIHDSGWVRWHDWDEAISCDWKLYTAEQMNTFLTDITELELQEPEKQNRFKLSYYLPLTSNHQRIMDDIDQILARENIRANLIWSIDEEKDIGLLDVLPASANKLHAIQFLMQQCGYDEKQTVFAGDSGNDLDVITSTVQSVLVANASSDVRDAVLAENSGKQNSIYMAHGALPGMNGNYSVGIIEGLLHFRPDLIPFFEELMNE